MAWVKTILILIVAVYVITGLFLYLFQERLIFRPDVLPPDFDYSFDAEFDELSLEMNDGAVLNALHFAADDPKGLIVYFHGNAGSLERWGEVAIPFTQYGYNVLMIDYRGYGKSTGVRSKKDMLEDAEMVYSYAASLWPQEKLIVYGRSLGSAFGCHVAGNFTPKLLILESPFFSVKDVASELAWMYPVGQIMRFNFKNGRFAERMTVPVTILHGDEDSVVPISSGKKLHKAITHSELRIIEGAGHNDLAAFKSYWDEIDSLLK